MNEIGKKIIFVGLPAEIIKYEKNEHDPINTFIKKMKEINIPFPDNEGWGKCRKNVNSNYRGLCEFISYEGFIRKDFHFYGECEALIFFSKIYDGVDIQEDEYTSIIEHCLECVDYAMQQIEDKYLENANWKPACEPFLDGFDDFLNSFDDYIHEVHPDAQTKKNSVNVKIDEIQLNNPKCKFCLIPLSGADNEYVEFFLSNTEVRKSEIIRTLSPSLLPIPETKNSKLNTWRLIVVALDDPHIISRDFDYFNLSLELKRGPMWRDALNLSDTQSNITNSVCLISPSPENTEMLILPHTSPDEFEENITELLSEMNYETNNNFDTLKSSVSKMYKGKSSKNFPLSGNSLKLTDLNTQIGLIKCKLDKYKYNESKSKIHILIYGEYGVGKQNIAEIIAEYSKNKMGIPFKGRIASTSCSGLHNKNIGYKLFGNKGNLGLITERVSAIILRDIDFLKPKSLRVLFDFMDHGKYSIDGENEERSSPCNIIATTSDPDFMINHKNRFYVLKVPNLNGCRDDIESMAESFCKAHCYDRKFKDIWKHLQENHLQTWENTKWDNRNIVGLKQEVCDRANEFIETLAGPGNTHDKTA